MGLSCCKLNYCACGPARILSNRLSSFPIALPRVGVSGLGTVTALMSSFFSLSKV